MEAFQKIQLAFKCPKALDDLQTCQNNWYCDGCQKMVYDFRGFSEEEILGTFAQNGQKLCGIYDADRIKVLPQKPRWYAWASVAMVVFGMTACHDQEVLLVKPSHIAQKQTAKLNSTINTVFGFAAITIQPEFPGGEAAWSKHIIEHLKYTGQYKGRVLVQFVVERDGSLSDIIIVRGGEPILNEQIINLIKNAPHWHPGIEAGKPLSVQYTMPLNFTSTKNNYGSI